MNLTELMEPTSAGRASVVIVDPEGAKTEYTGSQLIGRSSQVAHCLRDFRVVGTLLSNSADCIVLVMAAIQAGIRLVSLPLPDRGEPPVDWIRRLRRICDSLQVEALCIEDRYANWFEGDIFGRPVHSVASIAARAGRADGQVYDGFELIQHSSGTTSAPSPLLLTSDGLASNIEAMLETIEPEPSEIMCSWAPLSHDLGLMALLAGMAAASREPSGGSSLVLIHPERFLRVPSDWLSIASQVGATMTAAPPTSYDMVAKLAKHPTVDLRRLRLAVVAGELIGASSLRNFANRFGDEGFNAKAFSPAYGMAEIGVLASMVPPDAHWEAFEFPGPSRFETAAQFVGCGRPAKGVEIRLASCVAGVGSVQLRTRSVASSPHGPLAALQSDGWLQTSDLAFYADGQRVPVGRDDDVAVLQGINVPLGPLEETIKSLVADSVIRVAVVGTANGISVVLEATDGGRAASRFTSDVVDACFHSVGTRPSMILALGKGSIPRTLSGKVRRRALAVGCQTQTLSGEQLWP